VVVRDSLSVHTKGGILIAQAFIEGSLRPPDFPFQFVLEAGVVVGNGTYVFPTPFFIF
jgi:hypothetical protein